MNKILTYSGFPPQNYPENLNPEDRFMFESNLRDPVPQCVIKQMPAFRTSSEGILMRDWQILFEGSPYYFERNHPYYVQVLKRQIHKNYVRRLARYYFSYPAEVLKQPCVWLTDHYSHHYFHWICETLPRIYLWHSIDNDNRPVIIPGHYLQYSYIKQSLDFFGSRNFIFLDTGKVYKIQKASFVSPMGKPYQFNSPLMLAYAEFVLQKNGLTLSHIGDAGKRIYINRQKAKRRKAVNDYEIDVIFSRAGFDIVQMEDFSIVDQIRLINQCSVIAGLHGAGLANLVFSSVDTKVLEIQQRLGWPSVFFRLSSAMNKSYYYLYGQSSPGMNMDKYQYINADLYIDPLTLTHEIAKYFPCK